MNKRKIRKQMRPFTIYTSQCTLDLVTAASAAEAIKFLLESGEFLLPDGEAETIQVIDKALNEGYMFTISGAYKFKRLKADETGGY